jgi:hypothetical protein
VTFEASVYLVLFKAGLGGYLKARPLEEFSKPEKGMRPLVCNTLLSPVKEVYDLPFGYEIITKNSRYKVLRLPRSEFEKLLESGAWVLDRISETGSLYFRRQ